MGCSESTAEQPSTKIQVQVSEQPSQGQTSPQKPAAATTPTTKNPKHELQLTKHNQYRKKHGADPLILSEWLNKGAQAWADHLGSKNLFEHSKCTIDGKGVGENIYWSSASPNGGDASKAWYDEVKDYKYGSGESTFNKTGHFSQLVWKASKEVGFGYCAGIVVANYYPGGNLMGSWEKNVGKP